MPPNGKGHSGNHAGNVDPSNLPQNFTYAGQVKQQAIQQVEAQYHLQPGDTGFAAALEKAIANVYEQARSGPITREMVLDGLWQMKNEKLDGLAPGVTYNKNALPNTNNCYALLNLTTTGYSAPKGSKFFCFPSLPKGF